MFYMVTLILLISCKLCNSDYHTSETAECCCEKAQLMVTKLKHCIMVVLTAPLAIKEENLYLCQNYGGSFLFTKEILSFVSNFAYSRNANVAPSVLACKNYVIEGPREGIMAS